MATNKPLIGIPTDRRLLGQHPFHCVGEKYIAAVADGAGGIPILIPSLGEGVDLAAILSRVDGLLLTGSASNVEPHRYQGPASEPGTWHDPHRDATTLPMILRAVTAGIPILGICRGFQEMNVAFGGTLHQKLHDVDGLNDHREDEAAPLAQQYGPAHTVELTAGGLLHSLAGKTQIHVNSLHSQGVQTLGVGLRVEARAPDGVIEAFQVIDAASFALAVQWHPEWHLFNDGGAAISSSPDNHVSRALFAAFGAAAYARAQHHSHRLETNNKR